MGGPVTSIVYSANGRRDMKKPRKYATDARCQCKRRACTEPEARALAAVEMDESPQIKRLWVYECRHCAGWHLTSRNQGSRYAVERQGAK